MKKAGGGWLAALVEGVIEGIDRALRSRLVLSICARVTHGVVVRLHDHDGDAVLSIARHHGSRLVAERWWPLSIRPVELRPDGTCRCLGIDANYVERWSFV